MNRERSKAIFHYNFEEGDLHDRELKMYPPLLVQIENRVRRLYRAVVRADRYFWPGLLDPGGHLLVSRSLLV
jgi:hypothetical protein